MLGFQIDRVLVAAAEAIGVAWLFRGRKSIKPRIKGGLMESLEMRVLLSGVDPLAGISFDSITGTTSSSVTALGVTVDSEERIVVVGKETVLSGYYPDRVFVARFLPTGDLDTTFDSDGVYYFGSLPDPNNVNIHVLDGEVAMQHDPEGGPDKAVIAISISNGGSHFQWDNAGTAIARFDDDGSLDTTFGDPNSSLPGTVLFIRNAYTFGVPIGWDFASEGLVVRDDGSFVVGGTFNASTQYYTQEGIAFLGFTPDGEFDDLEHFRSGTILSEDFYMTAMAQQPDGKIVFTGFQNNTQSSGPVDFWVGRILAGGFTGYSEEWPQEHSFFPEGTPDMDFGPYDLGLADLDIDDGSNDIPLAIAIDGSGNILVGGQSDALGDYGFALARFTADGELDDTFGDGGVVLDNVVTGGHDFISSLAIGGDDSIWAFGSVDYGSTSGNADFQVTHYLSDGSTDTDFNEYFDPSYGPISYGLGSGNGALRFNGSSTGANHLWAAAVQPSGSSVIVVGGSDTNNTGNLAIKQIRTILNGHAELPATPSAPSNVTVTALGRGDVRLTWVNTAGSNADGVIIWPSVSMDGRFGVAPNNTSPAPFIFGPDATSAVLSGFDPGTNVSFELRAYNNGGQSSATNSSSVTVGQGNNDQVGLYSFGSILYLSVHDGSTPIPVLNGSSGYLPSYFFQASSLKEAVRNLLQQQSIWELVLFDSSSNPFYLPIPGPRDTDVLDRYPTTSGTYSLRWTTQVDTDNNGIDGADPLYNFNLYNVNPTYATTFGISFIDFVDTDVTYVPYHPTNQGSYPEATLVTGGAPTYATIKVRESSLLLPVNSTPYPYLSLTDTQVNFTLSGEAVPGVDYMVESVAGYPITWSGRSGSFVIPMMNVLETQLKVIPLVTGQQDLTAKDFQIRLDSTPQFRMSMDYRGYGVVDSGHGDPYYDDDAGTFLHPVFTGVIFNYGGLLPADLDIDTDNNDGIGLPGKTLQEETYEDNPNWSGKVFLTSTGDLDGDSTPDFADDVVSDLHFAKMVLTLPPQASSLDESDLDDLTLTFQYSASDPDSATSTTLAPGTLRVWLKDGDETRDSVSDFLAADEDIGGDRLTWEWDEESNLWYTALFVEAVAPTSTLDSRTISISVFGADGESYGGDDVLVTAIQPTPTYYGDPSAGPGGAAPGSTGGNPMALGYSGNVRLSDGAVSVSAKDISSDAYGLDWGQTRTWTTELPAGINYRYGNNVIVSELPFLVQATGSILAVGGGRTFRYYDAMGEDESLEFVPRFFTQDQLAFVEGAGGDSSLDEYILTDTLGNQTVFYGFSDTIEELQRGQMKKFISVNGGEMWAEYDTGGVLVSVDHYLPAALTTPVESYLFDFYAAGSDGRPGMLKSVTFEQDETAIKTIEYTYYQGTGEDDDAFGTRGDLKTASIRYGDENSPVVDTWYYRYHIANLPAENSPTTTWINGTPSGSAVGRLQYVFSPDSFARMEGASITPLTASSSAVAPYADNAFTYYGDLGLADYGRAHQQIMSGAGAGSSPTSGGQRAVAYVYSIDGEDIGIDTTYGQTLVVLPVNSVSSSAGYWLTFGTEYFNYAGELLSDMTQGVTTPSTYGGFWLTNYGYDDLGRLTSVAEPSAATSSSEGLVHLYAYADTTTADEDTAGSVSGYLESTSIKRGTSGTEIPQSSLQYKSIFGTVNGQSTTIYYVTESTVYSDGAGADAITTTTDVTPDLDEAFGGENSVSPLLARKIDITLPLVSTAQHGPGTANTQHIWLDEFGRSSWAQAADGSLTFTAYDDDTTPTGTVTSYIIDADDDGNPFGITRPGGLPNPFTLSTTSASGDVDALGRPLKVTAPTGMETSYFYLDSDDEKAVATYVNWHEIPDSGSPSMYTTTGPVRVQRLDREHNYFEIADWYLASFSSTAPQGLPNAVSGSYSLLSLHREILDLSGRVVETRDYYDLSDITYSTSRDLGDSDNYLSTFLGYGADGQVNRQELATGTITRTVNDGIGRPVEVWAGTDDTPDSGTWVPNAAGTNLVLLSKYFYDEATPGSGTSGSGDGNLTSIRTYIDSTNYRLSFFGYDWRDRLVLTRGPDRVGVQSTLNNLGIATATDVFADLDNDYALDSGEFRSHTETSVDDWGHIYQSQQFAVNQSTGVIDTSTSMTADFWHNIRGQTSEARGSDGLTTTLGYTVFGALELQTQKTTTGATFGVSKNDLNPDDGRLMGLQSGTTTDNLTDVLQYWYDSDHDGGGDDQFVLTGTSGLLADGTSNLGVLGTIDLKTLERQTIDVAVDPDGAGPLKATYTVTTKDPLGRDKVIKTYKQLGSDPDPDNDLLLSQTENVYHVPQRSKEVKVYKVSSSGTASDPQVTTYFYDFLGNPIEVRGPNGQFNKTSYRRDGLVLASYVGTTSESNDDPATVTGDTIVEQVKHEFDSQDHPWLTRTYQRNPGISDTGELTASNSRVNYQASWFSGMADPVKTVNYGTNGGAVIDEQSDDFDPVTSGVQAYSAGGPTAAGSTLYSVTTADYDGFRRPTLTTDNDGKVTLTLYEADSDRPVLVIHNFHAGNTYWGQTGGKDDYSKPLTRDADVNQITQYVYNDAKLLVQLIALDPKNDGYTSAADNQITRYFYSYQLDSTHKGSPVPRNDLLRAVVSPDNSLTDAQIIALLNGGTGARDFVEYFYNANNTVAKMIDQRGVVHEYEYDGWKRQTTDKVTNLGSSGIVDNSVLRIDTAYTDRDQVKSITSYSSATGGTGNIVNQVVFDRDDWGGVSNDWQSHQGAAVTSGGGTLSPKVSYGYASSLARMISMTYPTQHGGNDFVVGYNYGTSGSIDDKFSRVVSFSDASTGGSATFVSYTRLGLNTMVKVEHPSITGGVTLSYGSASDAGGGFAGLDQFGQPIDHKWANTAGTTTLDEYAYGYDGEGNRIWKQNVTSGSLGTPVPLDEFYAFDDLYRLTDAQRGTLNGTKTGLTGTVANQQTFALDGLGNWTGYDVSVSGTATLDQTRATNNANEIDGNSGNPITETTGPAWIDPTYDGAGNMIETPKAGDETTKLKLKFDAWNRLMKVTDASNNLVAEFKYDGRDYRIAKITPNGSNFNRVDYYYNESWQVVEERLAVNIADPSVPATAAYAQYVWDKRYIDTPVLRFLDADGNAANGLEETLYYLTDANRNVTALVDTSGSVLERYVYDPYGKQTVYDGSWAVRSGGSAYGNQIGFQGQRLDPETGLDNARNRYYHPTLGTWISRDPVGYPDGLNTYRAYNAPQGADPFGLADGDDESSDDSDFIDKYYAASGNPAEQARIMNEWLDRGSQKFHEDLERSHNIFQLRLPDIQSDNEPELGEGVDADFLPFHRNVDEEEKAQGVHSDLLDRAYEGLKQNGFRPLFSFAPDKRPWLLQAILDPGGVVAAPAIEGAFGDIYESVFGKEINQRSLGNSINSAIAKPIQKEAAKTALEVQSHNIFAQATLQLPLYTPPNSGWDFDTIINAGGDLDDAYIDIGGRLSYGYWTQDCFGRPAGFGIGGKVEVVGRANHLDPLHLNFDGAALGVRGNAEAGLLFRSRSGRVRASISGFFESTNDPVGNLLNPFDGGANANRYGGRAVIQILFP